MALEGLNSGQLKEHYAMCIQLCSTNKINSKNAFGLHIIDYMNQLTKSQKDGNLNFKLVSSTLDVGTKIYSNRVDSVNTQAQKVASNLHHALDDKNRDKDKDDDIENEEDDDEQKKKKTKQRQTRKNKTIGTKESVTLTNLEFAGEQDQLFLKLSSTVDVGAANSFLIETLDIDPSYTFRIDSNEPYYDLKKKINKLTTIEEENFDDKLEKQKLTDINEFYDKINDLIKREDLKICPRLDTFSFNNLNDEFDYGQNSAYAFRNLSMQEDNLLFNDDLDINENLDDNLYDQQEYDGSGNDFGLGQNDYSLAHKSMINTDNAQFMLGIIGALSDNPSDYCLFDKKITLAWAGHEYWKPNPIYRMKMNQLLQQNKQQQNQEKAKRTRKVFGELNFDNYEDEKIAEKSEIKLKLATLENWRNNKSILLPEDFKREPVDFVLRFSKEQYNLFRKRKDVQDDQEQDDNSNIFDNDLDDLNDNYNDEQNSQLGGTEFNLDEIFDLGTQETEQVCTQSGQMPFIGDNLVDQPQMIPTINLPYTKFAKKIDVKRLKCAIWNLIKTTDNEFDEFNETKKAASLNNTNIRMELDDDHSNLTEEEEERSNSNEKYIHFSTIYQQLPNKVNSMLAKNLSAPITLVTLLHVVNEKNLKIEGCEDLSDFSVITKEELFK